MTTCLRISVVSAPNPRFAGRASRRATGSQKNPLTVCSAEPSAPEIDRRPYNVLHPVTLLSLAGALSAGLVFAVQGMAFPNPAHAGDLALGRTVFSNTCGACHTGGQNVVSNEKTLKKEALVAYLDGGFSESSIITQVRNGKGAMPAWEDSLSEEEISAVAAFVYDQANGNKW